MISRRSFIKKGMTGAMAIAVGPVFPFSVDEMATRTNEKKIIIIGAGLAGLSAADELLKRGYKVSVLEAQMRPGGRVQTFREPFADGLYADMGAARIPENHSLVVRYTHELGLNLIPFLPEEGENLHFIRGQKMRYQNEPPDLSNYPVELTKEEHKLGWDGIGKEPFHKLLRKLGDPKSMKWPHPAIHPYDEMDLKQFLNHQGYSDDVRKLLLLGYVENHPYDVSMLEWIRELSLSFGTKRYRIEGGNDLLPRRLAQKLGSHISYGCELIDLDQSETNAIVHFKKNGITYRHTADRVICTLPLGVLKRMNFTQRFSVAKLNAIRDMNIFPLSRTVLQMKERFWKKEGLSGSVKTDLPSEIWDPCYEKEGSRALLSVYFKSSKSLQLDEFSETRRVTYATQHLSNVFDAVSGNVEGGVSKQWGNDRWAGGGTVLAGRGDMVKCQKQLSLPEGRVYFAGEHTSAYHGWMQGAIESGIRVANEVHAH